ncbi:hypothetical protein EYR36_004766 [Pleurotus pulmonarius]|nr:hypothetical protein EYR36_004766 [Pleurotus pulmonarius]
MQHILVVGGNGFIGSAICKAALSRGMQVTSVSSSGRPYQTPKGHSPAWTSKVQWIKGDALHPDTFADILPEVNGVVHTLGTLLEDGEYKAALRQGDVFKLFGSFLNGAMVGGANPLKRPQGAQGTGRYEALNRDSALRVCEAFVANAPRASGPPRPFVYISAEDIFRPIIPAKYIETKREAERGLELLLPRESYRGVYVRPSLVYHAHYRPLTSPAAVLFDLSANLHAKAPLAFPTPSRVLRHLASAFPSSSASLQSIANAMIIPPIHVDHVAAATCIALDQPDVHGYHPRLVESIASRSLMMHALRRNNVVCSAVMNTTRQCNFSTAAASRRALPFFSSLRGTQTGDERDTKFLRMLMFGKPGAGKGTLSARLVKKYDILSLSTGDLLRQHIAEGTPVGQQAEKIVAQGSLLPDELMLKVVTSRLDLIQNRHWILDGFPRTLGQSKLLDAHLSKQSTPLTFVVNIDVPDDVILSRISDRWVHLPSGRVYNMSYNRPKVDGYDDETGEPLTKRPDDNPEVFAHRLRQFYTSTSPLLSYYTSAAKTQGTKRHPNQHPHQLFFPRPHKLHVSTISGTTSDEIWPKLDGHVKHLFPNLRQRPDETKRHSLSDALIDWDRAQAERQ